MTIQRVYNIFQQIGLVGQLARAGEPNIFDSAESATGVSLVPGDGVYRNTSGQWIKPVDVATRKLVTHIVSFDTSVVSTPIVSPTTNSIGQIVYAAGSRVKALAIGTLYAIAGEALVTGDKAIYNHSTGRWIKYAPVAGDITDFRTAVFEAVSPAAADGDIFELRAYGPIKF